MHLGHNYLPSAFLSPGLNRRSDGWGGDGYRGGLWLEESLQVGQWLEADGALDAIELTAGSSLKNPMYLFRGDAPVAEMAAAFPQPMRTAVRLVGGRFLKSYPYQEGYLLPFARQFRQALSMPLIALGGISRRAADSLCIHCNKCMPTIYQGTHCVLVPQDQRPGAATIWPDGPVTWQV